MVKRRINNLGNDTSDAEDEEDNYNNNVAKMGKASSNNKFGTWKGDTVEKSDESGDETKQERVQTPRFSGVPELPGTPTGGVVLGESSSSATHTAQVSIQMDSTLSPSIEVGPESAEEEPDPQPTYIQQIKNKIWLKLPVNKFTKLSQNEETEEKAEKTEEERARAKKHSRMNTSSLKQVTRRLHLSYGIAIVCFIIALLVAFITLTSEFKTLNGISKDLRNADLRTMYAHLVLYDVEVLSMYQKDDQTTINAANSMGDHLAKMWETHKAINPPDFQMELLYGSGCYRINQSLCPTSVQDYPYYDLINKGVEYTFMYNTVGNLSFSDPTYLKFRSLAENDMMDGLERLTFTFQRHASDQIASAKLRVGIITGIVCVAFVAIHVIIFKPFVRRLKEESEHTFSIIRMIPRKMLTDVAEVQEFIQESIDAANKEY